ncbi:MAG: putative 7-carboxy-7-deazaguanine synthase QueE [Acholeplasmatales bacterium]|nr:putative 7-carboxy-7-deazaguanine synthase QueE [Acholeplasmatales bacterium]
MKVIELFLSINGEGLKSGELATFVRFAGCNLRCPYCDTKYSYENPIYKEMSIEEILSRVEEYGAHNVCLTGGEPLIQKDVDLLIKALSDKGYRVELETNGSVDITPYVGLKGVCFTLDYKGPTSLMESHMLTSNYRYLTKNDVVKFVCGNKSDLEKAKEIILKYSLADKANPFLSPMFGEINLEGMVDFMKDNRLNGVRMQIQIHKIIWDKDKRGV